MRENENIFYGEFPKSVIDQANAAARIRTSSYLARRLDLRGKTVFAFAETPETPTECAYSLYRNGSGWRLGIHIADVCEYVCEGSPLDIEARKRLATIRSSSAHSEMLPSPIVSDLCNFSKNGDKLAISALIDLDSDGNIISMDFDESVILISGLCIYGEIDRLQQTSDNSSVMFLREKYAPFTDILGDMYELAAKFCMNRIERGGLDCTYFRRVYERDSEGKIISFRRESEPDSRAMLREIGYFAAQAVGKYMLNRRLPCIFNGRDTVTTETLDYLSDLVGIDNRNESPTVRAAQIADAAKGSEYYEFVCDALSANIPHAEFATSPIYNSFCANDHIVSFFNPVTHYTDLLIQRTLKTAILARDPKNLNLNRQQKIVNDTAAEANSAEQFIYKVRKQFATADAIDFIKSNIKDEFVGFPVYTSADGEVFVVLECGIKAIIPAEYGKAYTYESAHAAKFEIISIETDVVAVKPII